ncbi:MAG: DUF4328 domain-containing protein [Planctomycetales bacterium]|nr:DUF4328 domain-containing protein [Planctomycetales bacterium]
MDPNNPYHPPSIPEEEEPPRARRSSSDDEYEALPFRSPQLLGRIFCFLMGIVMVLDLIAAYCAVAFYQASGGEFTPPEELDYTAIMLWQDGWNTAVSVSWLVFVVAYLILIAWTYRCHCNLESLGHRELDSKHIWALICWFVPVLNLFTPYQVVREIWWRSHPLAANTPESAPASHLVFWWWLMRMTALGTVFLSYCFSPHESWPQYYTYFRIVFLGFTCDLLDSILAILLILRISQWQVARHRSLQLATVESA